MTEEEEPQTFEFDMTKNAMVIAFPYCRIPGSDLEFVGPPTFVANMPSDRDPHQQMEAALLFALTVVREGRLKDFGEVPDDISSLKEDKQ